MDFNIEVRKKQLKSLDQYITSSKDKVQSILDYLGWSTKGIIEQEPEVVCPINSGHIIKKKIVDSHSKKCYIKTLGYMSDDEFLSEAVNNSSTSIKLDQKLKIEILNKAHEVNQKFKPAWTGQDTDPMTSDRMFTTFSPDERLALYDYVVQNTERLPIPAEFNVELDDKKGEEALTRDQLLARERDAKRRRIKYKSVHTGRKKSHTEILREVIGNQMEQYSDKLMTKLDIDRNHTNIDQNNEQNLNTLTDIDTSKTENIVNIERPSSSTSRHSNHSSNSRYKKDSNNERDMYNNHDRDIDYKRSHDKRHNYISSSYHSPYREKRRYRDFEGDYKRSRDKRDSYYKSERRH